MHRGLIAVQLCLASALAPWYSVYGLHIDWRTAWLLPFAHGALIASAPALCRFLDAFWISGEPRRQGERQEWTHFGSLPGTSAMIRQRMDGYNIAVLCNGRRSDSYTEDNTQLKKLVDQAIV